MKTELKVLFYLKKNETDADGKCPVMGRINIGSTMEQFSAKTKVQASLWDTKSGRATGKSKHATEVNASLNAISVAINSHYKEITARRGQATALQVKQAFQGIASAQDTLVSYFELHIEKFERRVGVDRASGTLNNNRFALATLKNFLRTKYNLSDIPFSALNRAFIEDYVHYMRTTLHYGQITLHIKARFLRRLIRDAIAEGIITRNPFEGYKIGLPESKPKFMTREELDRLITTPLSKPNLILSRDMFLIACFTGLSYCDLYSLCDEDFVKADDGVLWIRKERGKTGTRFSVPLLDFPRSLIDKYKYTEHGRFLPVPENSTLNKHLKELMGLCGIKTRLTCHGGRHTYASEITLAQGVSIESVSSMLGHRCLEVTQVYARVTDENIDAHMTALEKRIEKKYHLAL